VFLQIEKDTSKSALDKRGRGGRGEGQGDSMVPTRPAMPNFSNDVQLYTFIIYEQLEMPEARS
jgi:hypothetical protein